MDLIQRDWYCPQCGATVQVAERTPGYWRREAATAGLALTADGTPLCHGAAMVDKAASAELPPTHWYPVWRPGYLGHARDAEN